MSPPFAFIPRKVAKKKTNTAKVKNSSGEQGNSPSLPKAQSSSKGKEKEEGYHLEDGSGPEQSLASTVNPKTGGKNTFKLTGEGYAILLCLALSDYALWSNPDLRRKMDPGFSNSPNTEIQNEDIYMGVNGSKDVDNGGFIPLSYLLHTSPFLSQLLQKSGDAQVPIIKSLRTYAFGIIDVRLLVSAPQPWFNRSGAATSSTSVDAGGYEVRRQDWATLTQRDSFLCSKADWDKRAVYAENIPVQYRSIPAITKFIRAILPPSSDSHNSVNKMMCVQNITLLPHHQDKPGVWPACKGFALVTFLRSEDADAILHSWPWNYGSSFPLGSSEKAECVVKDAIKFGFRAISKANWENLRAEYLLHRQRLVDEINASQDAKAKADLDTDIIPIERVGDNKLKTHAAGYSHPGRHNVPDQLSSQPSLPTITPHSPYPFGCLVFVKNIHPETNKTTLKALLGRAFVQELLDKAQLGGLDYVDFNKGMDTCHLRLSTPLHAEALASYFKCHPTSQTKGLDDVGLPQSGVTTEGKVISMEIILGKREEMYWQKVPEKVRRSAVEKSLQFVENQEGGSAEGRRALSHLAEVEDQRPKKRRKR